MSGIFGIARLDGRPSLPEHCEAMARVLRHRGPDGTHVRPDGAICFGHSMLRTTPEAGREVQPLASAEGDLLLTADVRLDNRKQLMGELGLQDTLHSDVELILASYRLWGERCVEHWVGDFAVAVWDSRKRRLFCARDPLGVKPFYYHHTPGRIFAFASEVRALLALEEIPDEINEFEVARHLRIPLAGDASTTYYRHVHRLLPAHYLLVTDSNLESRHYWRPDPTRELRLSSDDEYAEALREAFVEAVRCRMRSGTPVASMLSGGIDSASITCVAARLSPELSNGTLHTLSAIYPAAPESDEREFIDDVLRMYPVESHSFAADTVSPVAEIDRMNQLIGGPSWGPNLYLNWQLYGIAAQVGARVVLDGFDGDTTLSHGVAYLTELAMRGHWWKLARVSVPFSRRLGRPFAADYLDLLRTGIRRSGAYAAVGAFARRSGRGKNGTTRLPSPGPIINPEFARRFSDQIAEPNPPPATEREHHVRKLNGMALFEGIGWLEACAAGRGVEVRLPFCDVRLIELCLSFPADQKIREGWTRYGMRRAMEGILPPKIQWRTGKTDLHSGWATAWRSNQDGRIDAMLAEPSHLLKQYLDMTRVAELYGRFLKAEINRYEGLDLWRALSLALWLSSEDDRA